MLHSNAVVLAMMDVSGSMSKDKKYMCRSLLFWLVEFLKKSYDFVTVVDGFPDSELELPTVTIEALDIDPTPKELGNRVGRKDRLCNL